MCIKKEGWILLTLNRQKGDEHDCEGNQSDCKKDEHQPGQVEKGRVNQNNSGAREQHTLFPDVSEFLRSDRLLLAD